MAERPLSLTILASLSIFGGLSALYTSATMASNSVMLRIAEQSGLPLGYHQFIVFINGIVSLASAYGTFKGQPWARVLLLIWQVMTIALSLLPPLIPGIVIFNVVCLGIIWLFYFREPADRWFGATGFQLRRSA